MNINKITRKYRDKRKLFCKHQKAIITADKEGTHNFEKSSVVSIDNDLVSLFNEESNMMTQDLMKLMGNAIDEWVRQYHLENLPKKIVFQQVFAAMKAMNVLINWDK